MQAKNQKLHQLRSADCIKQLAPFLPRRFLVILGALYLLTVKANKCVREGRLGTREEETSTEFTKSI